jgi:hypothetical protein
MYRSLEERSLVYFSDNELRLLRAYVDSGEGLDRAGGFAIQVRGYTQRTPSRLFFKTRANRAWVEY